MASCPDFVKHMLPPESDPICILDYKSSGGSAIFGRNLIAGYLKEGRGVLHLVHDRHKRRIVATALRGEERAQTLIPSLAVLREDNAPKIKSVCINELVNWSPSRKETLFHLGNGFFNGLGRSRHVGAVLQQVAQLADFHHAELIYFVHDYYAICPSPHLLNRKGRFCGIPRDLAVCAACMPRTRQHLGVSIPRWRAEWQSLLTRADQVNCVSDSTASYLREVFTFSPRQVRIVTTPDSHHFDRIITVPSTGPMKVAVVGHIDYHKGARVVVELAELLARDCPEARIVVAGSLEADEVPPNIMVTGPYKVEELPCLLEEKGCTIGLLPSIIPETYSMVTRELMQLELPLVCFPLGAPQDRVGTWDKGLVAKGISAEAALEALITLDTRRFIAGCALTEK